MVITILKRALGVLLKKPVRLWGISLLNTLLTALAFILCGPVLGLSIGIILLLQTSMTMLYLHGYRGEQVEVEMLFECFKDWKTAKHVLAGMAWMYLWVLIWSLIPVVGFVIAIIKSYSYRFTPYILVTRPELSATQALKESMKETNGYKGKMFGADMLVCGIFFLCFFVLGLLSAIPFIGVIFGLVTFLLYVVTIALLPLYQGLVQAAFYDEVDKKSNPDPDEFKDPAAE